MTGRGADYLVIDDPHSEQDALSETAMERAYEWYTSGPRQRLQPGGKILLVMTRWSKADLTGKVLARRKQRKLRFDNCTAEYKKSTKILNFLEKLKNIPTITGKSSITQGKLLCRFRVIVLKRTS